MLIMMKLQRSSERATSSISFLFLCVWFCRTWTKRYLITSQTRVKRVSRIHHRTILIGLAARNRLLLSFSSSSYFLSFSIQKKVLYRLLASVLSVGTSPWQWLRVTSRQQLAVDVNSPWLMAGVGLELEKVGDEERAQRSIRSPADFRRWFSLITTYNHMNFPTAAGEVETHKFQLSIVYHLLLFSVGVRRLPRSRFLASAMLSKDSTRTELGKRPIPTRRVGHNLNTITYRRSLLSRQPNSYHRRNRKDKREDNLVSHSLLLFGYSGNNQVTSSPGWDRHRTTRPGPRCVPPFFLFHYPLVKRSRENVHQPRIWTPNALHFAHAVLQTSSWLACAYNRPLYLLLSGFARGQALGCHAVARADRMQKSMQKHCRDHGKRLVCRPESSTSSFNFFSKPLVSTLPPPRPSLGWDPSSCLWSWTCAWDQGEEAACHRRRWCCRCSRPVGRRDKFAKSLRKQESRSRNTRNVRKKWSVYLPPRMWECQLKSCALAYSLLRTWKETTSWGIHFWMVCRPVGSSLESVGYWVKGENPQPKVCCERGKRQEEHERCW